MLERLQSLLAELKTPAEIVNLFAASLFFGRFLVQWIASERRKEVVIPEAFWWISIVASLVAVCYGVMKHAPSIVIQQLVANAVYGRNLFLARRARNRLGIVGGAE